MVSSEMFKEESLELGDFAGNHVVNETSDTSINDADLFFTLKWLLSLELFLHIASASTTR